MITDEERDELIKQWKLHEHQDRITATEVVMRQKTAEREWNIRAEEEIKRMADAVVAKKIAEIAEANAASGIISDTLEANPQYNDRTKEIVKTLCKLYPKLDSVTLPGKELLIPFIFSIAYDIQEMLEETMPEELKSL